MNRRNLLLVAYHFPPFGGSGVQRALKLARYLPECGWNVHVLTAAHRRHPLIDESMSMELGEGVCVHRVLGLEPGAVAAALRRLPAAHLRAGRSHAPAIGRCHTEAGQGKGHNAAPGGHASFAQRLEDRLYWRLDRAARWLPLCEIERLWVPAASRAARRIARRHEIQAVITTSPPHVSHLVGRSVRRRLGIPWIADLRDPILDNFAYEARSASVDRRWRDLERIVIQEATRVVVTCPEPIDALQERYPTVPPIRFATIPNGYDPADAPQAEQIAPPEQVFQKGATGCLSLTSPMSRMPSPRKVRADDPPVAPNPKCIGASETTSQTPFANRRFVLAHVGAFYRDQSVEPLLAAIRRLMAARPEIAGSLELRLVGSLSTQQRSFVQPSDDVFLRLVGYRPHREAIREMAAADALFLTTPPSRGGRYCIPAKTFEYLAFGRHVIGVVHQDTALADILRRAGNATLLNHRAGEDMADLLARAIASALDAWTAGALDRPRDYAVVESFRRHRLARTYADLLNRCTPTESVPPNGATGCSKPVPNADAVKGCLQTVPNPNPGSRMNILWHMPVLRRHTCGLSIRAFRDAAALQSFGHRVTFAVADGKTDFDGGRAQDMALNRLTLRRVRPPHWSLQAVARRRAADHAVRLMEGDHDLFISCQPEVVAAYRRRHPDRPIVFVCGGSTLLHDDADAAQYASLNWTRRAFFIIDRRLKRANERAAFRAADVVAFNSFYMRSEAIRTFGLRPEKCHTICAGLDENHFRPPTAGQRAAARTQLALATDGIVLAWTGRLAPEKNVELLISALPRCRRPILRLLLVGDGPLRAELEALARRRGVDQLVTFCGAHADVLPFLHAADIFAFPSRSESFGISLVEAMGCGLPCIALAVRPGRAQNASAEILAGGACGLIVADDPAAFARAIDSLADTPAYRAELGRRAAAHALANFTWSAAGRRFHELIAELTAPRLASPAASFRRRADDIVPAAAHVAPANSRRLTPANSRRVAPAHSRCGRGRSAPASPKNLAAPSRRIAGKPITKGS